MTAAVVGFSGRTDSRVLGAEWYAGDLDPDAACSSLRGRDEGAFCVCLDSNNSPWLCFVHGGTVHQRAISVQSDGVSIDGSGWVFGHLSELISEYSSSWAVSGAQTDIPCALSSRNRSTSSSAMTPMPPNHHSPTSAESAAHATVTTTAANLRAQDRPAEPGEPWTICDVMNWLTGKGLGDYALAIQRAKIDGIKLLETNDDDLRALGVASGLHRAEILDGIAEIRQHVMVPTSVQQTNSFSHSPQTPSQSTSQQQNTTTNTSSPVNSTPDGIATTITGRHRHFEVREVDGVPIVFDADTNTEATGLDPGLMEDVMRKAALHQKQQQQQQQQRIASTAATARYANLNESGVTMVPLLSPVPVVADSTLDSVTEPYSPKTPSSSNRPLSVEEEASLRSAANMAASTEEVLPDPDQAAQLHHITSVASPGAKAVRRAASIAAGATAPRQSRAYGGLNMSRHTKVASNELSNDSLSAPLPPPPRSQRMRGSRSTSSSSGGGGDEFPWWQTDLPGREALRLIDGQVNGAFVLRAQGADLILSFVYQGRIYDDLVLPSRDPPGVFLERVSNKLFRNVEEMVGYYMDPRPEMPVPLRVMLNPMTPMSSSASSITLSSSSNTTLGHKKSRRRHDKAQANAPVEQLTLHAQRTMSRRIYTSGMASATHSGPGGSVGNTGSKDRRPKNGVVKKASSSAMGVVVAGGGGDGGDFATTLSAASPSEAKATSRRPRSTSGASRKGKSSKSSTKTYRRTKDNGSGAGVGAALSARSTSSASEAMITPTRAIPSPSNSSNSRSSSRNSQVKATGDRSLSSGGEGSSGGGDGGSGSGSQRRRRKLSSWRDFVPGLRSRSSRGAPTSNQTSDGGEGYGLVAEDAHTPEWLQIELSSEGVRSILAGKPEGTFVVHRHGKNSGAEGDFVLTYCCKGGAPTAVRICVHEGTGCYYLEGTTHESQDIWDLVAYYSQARRSELGVKLRLAATVEEETVATVATAPN
eukprot:UC1_evm2s1639